MERGLANRMKKDRGSGFQRPCVTGFRNLLTSWNPFLDTGNYVSGLTKAATRERLVLINMGVTRRLQMRHLYEISSRFNALISDYSDKRLPPRLNPSNGYDD